MINGPMVWVWIRANGLKDYNNINMYNLHFSPCNLKMETYLDKSLVKG